MDKFLEAAIIAWNPVGACRDRVSKGSYTIGSTMPIPQSIFAYRPKLAATDPVADNFIDMLRSRIHPIEL
jgi:hypothetical protein